MTLPTPSAAASLEVTDEIGSIPDTSLNPKGSESRSPGRLAWKRFKRDRTGVISAYIVIFFFAIAILAPLIAKLYGKNPYTTYASERPELLDAFSYPAGANGGMSSEFWFGIEPQLGRDVFTFLLYGIRTSLGIAVAATLVTTIVGVIVGVTAGYLGGRTDYFVGRVIDILLSFPSTLFFIAFMPVVYGLFVAPDDNIPTSLRAISLIVVLSGFGWASIARLLRGQVLGLREREYIEAAKVTGASSRRIVFKELLPNLWTPIIIQSTLMLPAYVTAEAGLAFLGVGIIDPTPDWGVMIQRGAQFYTEDLTFMLFPGLSMVIFVLAFNLLGDSVRDALDPKSKR
ncbi:ABC transporter permease [Streptomyces sp. NPDC060011]|uniref:ABC transporter permease n=1 Tax=unclassified Streptomyces TaxID=2593676 RepID=UPI0013B926EC|nr:MULTISPECIES: ABC transporter permease [unclassified Streptomyces]MCX4916806.1 ABC transporter permease [Streptomyces sp. NBC_00687]MCX5131087.1 ABC transporter permease [Streptomyces sp. NBC_00340]NEB30826.1 ABC transporter permease [Streptomyces sp. SID14446]WSD77768.1 ABC transporter permease [Streptomyces sp. NBC_01558]WSK61358.1 ABC transporter permease [Streptomyces sp. NBC_01281]